MTPERVTILLPNYKTPELTALCLRALRRFTPPERFHLIAVDNASGDASLELLRTQRDLELIERDAAAIAGLSPAQMHATALDLALARVDTPLVLSIHTDTVITRPDWLDFLQRRLERSERVAGVGSWKLEQLGALKIWGKRLESWCRETFRGRKPEPEEHYLRSHCALFRTELVRRHTHGFAEGETAGKALCRQLTAAGCELDFLASWELMPYMRHLNHATMVLNPELGGRKTATARARRQLNRELRQLDRLIGDAR